MSVLGTSMKPGSIRYEDYVLLGILVTPWVLLAGMIALCCTAENRWACFRRWSRWLVFVAVVGVLVDGVLLMPDIEANRKMKVFGMQVKAQQEVREIEAAAELYARLSDKGVLPEGGNRAVIVKLMEPIKGDTQTYLGSYGLKLKLGADGEALDPWGRAYLMGKLWGDEWMARSAGPDGVWGTGDDVRSEEGSLRSR